MKIIKSTINLKDYFYCGLFNLNLLCFVFPIIVCCFSDVHSAASLTVSPDRAQHFVKELVSLSCEGNSTKWRVMRFYESGSLIDCTSWGTMTGSTCTINRYWLSGVYWCESETGQFSNAVNITILCEF